MYRNKIEKIIIDNSSGAYMKLKFLGLLEEVVKITEFLDEYDEVSGHQRFWHIKNKIYHIITCKFCENKAKFHRSYKYMTCGSEACKLISKNANYRKNCIRKYGIDHYQKTDNAKETISKNNYAKTMGYALKCANSFKEKLSEEYELLKFDENLSIYHKSCDSQFIINRKLFSTRKMRRYEVCTNCNPLGGSNVSQGEKQLHIYIDSVYGGEIIRNTRKIISPYELDIYLPDLNIAFEFNGDYDHANPKIYDRDHKIRDKKALDVWCKDKKKKILCINRGIDLIVVWQDEWENNKSLVMNEIKDHITIKGL